MEIGAEMNEREAATIKELVETISRFTPEKLNLFLSASQDLIERMQVRDDWCTVYGTDDLI